MFDISFSVPVRLQTAPTGPGAIKIGRKNQELNRPDIKKKINLFDFKYFHATIHRKYSAYICVNYSIH